MNTRITLLLCCLALNIGLFSKDIYIPSLPAIASNLHVSQMCAGQSITLFLIGMGLSQLIYGPISDRVGRKWVLISGLAVCLAGNYISTISDSINSLLFSRLLAGCGAGAFPVITRAIACDMNKGVELTKFISYLSMATIASPLLAPAIGGFLQDVSDWREPFLLLTIITFISIILFIRYYQESKVSVNTPALSVSKIIIKYPEIFKDKIFQCYTGLSIIAFSSGIIYLTFSPFIFQNLMHLSALENGLLYIYVAFGYFIGAYLAGKSAKNISEDVLIQFGLILCFVSVICILIENHFAEITAAMLSMTMFFNAVGSGIITPLANKRSIEKFHEYAGTAAALLGAMRMSGAFLVSTVALIIDVTTISAMAIMLLLLAASGFVLLGMGASVVLREERTSIA